MNRQKNITGLALLAALGAFELGVAEAVQWQVQPILDPTLPSDSYTPTGLNNNGVVVGQMGSGITTGFVTGPNGVGIQFVGRVFGPVGVDEAGEVAGSREGRDFISAPNSLTLNNIDLLPSASQSAFTGMSSDGRVIGLSGFPRNAPGTPPLPLYWGTTFVTGPHGIGVTEWIKPAPFTYARPAGINKSGQIIGNLVLSENPVTYMENSHAVLTDTDTTNIQDLGVLGNGDSSIAAAINDRGQVAGSSQFIAGQTKQHAFLTGPNGAAMKDLGDLGGGQSSAMGLNNLGQVVGSSNPTADESQLAAFITGPNGVGMRNLTQEVSLPGNNVLRVALGINDKGQVIAQDTGSQSYLLTPIPEGAASNCTVTYKVTYVGLGLFQAKVDVSNQSAATLNDWAVNWRYNLRPLLVASNAKVTLDGTSVSAIAKTDNKAVKSKSTVSFILTGTTKGGKAPTVSGMAATLGGKACGTTVQ